MEQVLQDLEEGVTTPNSKGISSRG